MSVCKRTLPKMVPAVCPKCGHIVGHIIQHEDKPWMDLGTCLMLVGQRACHVCGTVYRWHGDRHRFEDLAANYIQRMEAAV